MIKAVIYDMDGVIIDSEPLWRKAEIEVFEELNISLTEDMCKETMGLRVDEVIEYWSHKYPLNRRDFSKIKNLIMDAVIDLAGNEGIMIESVKESLDFFREKEIIVALASSSQMRLINAVIDRFCLRDYFSTLYSAEVEEYGKPHPGVYITTANKLGVPTSQCLAIEDSINGMLSAKAAKMKCIAVPDVEHKNDRRLGIADVILDSLENMDESVWQQLNT
ncbi:hexitol phosphatase HxpB [Patescibacteria group bacterium]|jgi:sugar-phosphatase|nr:hexitol phosphatase HxpB [Patescibacteria group bacterium]